MNCIVYVNYVLVKFVSHFFFAFIVILFLSTVLGE